jgi:hypothetical protein
MAQSVTLNGIAYSIPDQNDSAPWGTGLTAFCVAIPAGCLQKSGGLFTLTTEVDFGATAGVKALSYKSRTTNVAAAGAVRLAKTDTISFRNNANDGDVPIGIDGSNNLTFNSTKIILSGAIVNADVNASAAIAYSKLALTGSIVNADIGASAAIAVSKLAAVTASRALASDGSGFVAASSVTLNELQAIHSLTASRALAADSGGLIGAATTTLNELQGLNGLTASRAIVTNGSGILTVATTTATEIGYVNGVTSAIQTQIDTKYAKAGGQLTGSITFDSYATHGYTSTATNDSAPAGCIGEKSSASLARASATSVSTATAKTVISVSLTAGRWYVSGGIGYILTGAGTFADCAISATNNTLPAASALFIPNASGEYTAEHSVAITNTADHGVVVPGYIVNLSGTTTLYLVARIGLSSGTCTAYGSINAVRI